jgi:hypothetical protein
MDAISLERSFCGTEKDTEDIDEDEDVDEVNAGIGIGVVCPLTEENEGEPVVAWFVDVN